MEEPAMKLFQYLHQSIIICMVETLNNNTQNNNIMALTVAFK